MTDCPKCGVWLLDSEEACPSCGWPNCNYQPEEECYDEQEPYEDEKEYINGNS